MKMSTNEGFFLLKKWCEEARPVSYIILSGLAPVTLIAKGVGKLARVEEPAATITFFDELRNKAGSLMESLEIAIPLPDAQFEYSDAREIDNPTEPSDERWPEHQYDAQLKITLERRLLGISVCAFNDQIAHEIAEQTGSKGG